MQKFPRRWNALECINFLQRKIIINAIIYYEFDNNLISDKEYDELNKQLIGLHNEYGDITDTDYGYIMYDFDGTTGFDLYGRLNANDKKQLTCIARSISPARHTKKIERKRGRLF